MNHLIIFNNGISKNRMSFIRKMLIRGYGDNVTLKQLKDKLYDGIGFDNIFLEEMQKMDTLTDDRIFNPAPHLINRS